MMGKSIHSLDVDPMLGKDLFWNLLSANNRDARAMTAIERHTRAMTRRLTMCTARSLPFP